jgi:DNA-binding CsgD family transcriptional regulator
MVFSLTPRQRDVLDLLCRGLTAVEIGARLGISRRTVEAHANDIRRRAGARNMVHAVALLIGGERE